ncbi:MAG TPA: MarR family transcriptional regulator [Candidatus Baltobacteraceae bacterium]|nr:MarR family transcriptional regulator [Candidatus Baltobacteraceae bacterium]
MLSDNVTLAVGLSRADAALRRRLEGPLGGGHGIGFTDFQILAELDSVQGARLRASDLAGRLMLSPSGITRAVLPLEKIGLVERQAHERDARGTYVVLTAAGKTRVDEAQATVDRIVGETFAGLLTRTDRIALLGLFERLSY